MTEFKPKVVAISGYKNSGKDRAADILVSKLNFTKVNLASTLKDLVAEEYNIPRSYCDDRLYKEAPINTLPVTPKDNFSLTLCKYMAQEFRDLQGNIPSNYFIDDTNNFYGIVGNNKVQLYWTPRALCILKGSSNRAVSSKYWTEKVINKINNSTSNTSGYVISDLRYRSEIEQLKLAFDKNLILIRINKQESKSLDSSERDLDNFYFENIIDNTGTIYDLELKILNIVKNI